MALQISSCAPPMHYDIIIKGGIIYDGLGGEPYLADIGINADTIAAVGDLSSAIASENIDATGLAVSPGFINMLSWATESLIEDGRSQSDIRQGVTLEVFGEGKSYGPWNDKIKAAQKSGQGDIQYDIPWNTLDGYLRFLENKGVATNIASFIGSGTVRKNVLGYENRKPTEQELEEMKSLVRQAMEEGALGLGSALIYAPGTFADTDELKALCEVVAEYDGMYISHLRSEGNLFEEAVDELISIAQTTGVRAEIHHLKASGKDNWHKMDKVIAKVDSARNAGLNITANMYNYTAGATGLDASMPPWVQEGGYGSWVDHLKNPESRRKVAEAMRAEQTEWENLYKAAGSAENVLLVGFKNDSLRKYTGKTLAEVAKIYDQSPEETAMDLVINDGSRVECVYFLMSEENIKKKIQTPWVSFCSDAASLAPEGVFLNSSQHPRAYGNFAKLLGRYVRDERLILLEEAIRRLTSFPASNLGITKRGRLAPGFFADVVIFDLNKIEDHATFQDPHQYSTGMRDVFVNGSQVLKDGEHTGAFPGRVVRRGK